MLVRHKVGDQCLCERESGACRMAGWLGGWAAGWLGDAGAAQEWPARLVRRRLTSRTADATESLRGSPFGPCRAARLFSVLVFSVSQAPPRQNMDGMDTMDTVWTGLDGMPRRKNPCKTRVDGWTAWTTCFQTLYIENV
jgi:hypothetical protein